MVKQPAWDQADAIAEHERLIAESNRLTDALRASGKNPPPMPQCATDTTDILLAVDTLTAHVAQLRAAEKLPSVPAAAAVPAPAPTATTVDFNRDPYSPARIAQTRAATDHRIAVCENVIRTYGGTVPKRPVLFGDGAEIDARTMDAHAIRLERLCREAGVSQEHLDERYRKQSTPAVQLDGRKKYTTTELCLLVNAGKITSQQANEQLAKQRKQSR